MAILKDYSFRLSGIAQAPLSAAALGRGLHACAAAIMPALFLVETTREHVYNVLWVLVFAFATLNILSLGVRRLDRRGGLSFGEVVAIMVVVVSIILLGWELLYVFHIFPIRLAPQ